MKISRQTKQTFINEFRSEVFSIDDVINFFEPYIEVDAEAAILKVKKDIARRLVSARDKNNNRIFISFKKDRDTYFSNPMTETDMDIVNAMEKQLRMKIIGLLKTHRAVKRRKYILEGQTSIFNYENQSQSEIPQHMSAGL
jgi:hypothetical protein